MSAEKKSPVPPIKDIADKIVGSLEGFDYGFRAPGKIARIPKISPEDVTTINGRKVLSLSSDMVNAFGTTSTDLFAKKLKPLGVPQGLLLTTVSQCVFYSSSMWASA